MRSDAPPPPSPRSTLTLESGLRKGGDGTRSRARRVAAARDLSQPRGPNDRDRQSPGAPASPAAPVAARAGGAPGVLVVDDDDASRGLVRRHLERRGYAVSEAADGEAALQAVRRRLPDLIVADVRTPRFGGLSLTRALRADPRTDAIPILLLTGEEASEDRIEGLTAGADDVLTRPFEAGELIARVANLVAARQRLRVRFSTAATLGRPDVLAGDDAFALRVQEAIAAGMADEAFGVAELASALGMSRSTLHRRLTAATGRRPGDAIRQTRLDAASHLLRTGPETISEVAFGVGFRNLSHFSTLFRARFGMAPSAYRAAHAGGPMGGADRAG